MRTIFRCSVFFACVLLLLDGGQSVRAAAEPSPAPMRRARDLIRRQEGATIWQENYQKLTPETSSVVICLTTQRAYLMMEDVVAIDTPISSGKNAGMTPTGTFTVLEKDPNHHSNVYGNFQDRAGRTVRAGVSMKIDSAPSGSRFVGAPMKWFMRLTNGGVGMHVGILPGYAASHGCIRLPVDIAPKIYAKVKSGTPVEIVP